MYLNNAATGLGFNCVRLHQAAVELADTTDALFCVASPSKCDNTQLFQEFGVEHISHGMLRYKDCPDMYVFSRISKKLKHWADSFHDKFQLEYNKRMETFNRKLATSDVIIMKSSLFSRNPKHLEFEEIVISCTMIALEELRFHSLSLNDSDLQSCATVL